MCCGSRPESYTAGPRASRCGTSRGALGIRQTVVCGLSMGGYVLFDLLRRHRDRVKAIVLACTKPDADSAEARRNRDALAALAEREGQDAVVERLLPRLLAPVTPSAQPEVVGQVREMARRWSIPGIVGAVRAMGDRSDSTETLRQLRLPTLVLAGSEDQIAPPEVARAMAALVPGAQLYVVPDAGHLATLEQPLATTRRQAEFWNQVG